MSNKRPVNVEVILREGETTERLIRRFLKKFKKEKIIELYREHTFFKKPSLKRREKKQNKMRILNKIRREEMEKESIGYRVNNKKKRGKK